MFGKPEPEPAGYSYAPAPDLKPYEISLNSGTEFAKLVEGRSPDDIMPVIDEAMSLLKVVYPKCYDAIMAKLQSTGIRFPALAGAGFLMQIYFI